jgi:hypothetical protein
LKFIALTLTQRAKTTVIFQEGFEGRNFNVWTGKYISGGTASVQSTVVHHGSYAAKFALGL